VTKRARRGAAGMVAIAAGTAIGVSLVADARQETPEPAGPVAWSEGRVRVEVMNAGGVSGMAGAATESLREAGFDVVDFGDARPFDTLRLSEVVDRVGRTDVATAVAAVLGIHNVQSDPDPNLYVDVTVVLGSEWLGREGGTEEEQGEEVERWWDPRGWFGN
jgi:hypothetical protein